MANTIQLIPSEQYGFLPQRSTIQPLKILINGIKRQLQTERGSMLACFVDFSKAFDSVDRVLLKNKLVKNFNIRGSLFSLIDNILQMNTLFITDAKTLSKEIKQNIGLLQGDSLSPTLFILFIADIVQRLREGIPSLKVLLYADDLVFYSDSAEEIQKGLDNLEQYCDSNGLKGNTYKTKIMKFRNSVMTRKFLQLRERDFLIDYVLDITLNF